MPLPLVIFSPIPETILKFRIIIVVIIFILISGCEENSETEKHFPGGTFKLLLTDPVESLDPLHIIYDSDLRISSLVYEGLVGYGEGLNDIEPLLAESWVKLDEGRRWIFKLRDGVKFHQDPCFQNEKARLVTIDDIIYTFKRFADPNTTNNNWNLLEGKIKGFNEYHQNKTDTITGIRKLDNSHIEITLTKPYVNFLKWLSSPYAFIIPRHAVEYYGSEFKNHPVGTGPFRLALWKKYQEMLLLRNEVYWDRNEKGEKLPLLENIQMNIISNPDLMLSEFLKGESDLLITNDKKIQTLLSEKDFSKNYNVFKYPFGMGTRFLGFAMDKSTLLTQSKEIRKVIADQLLEKMNRGDTLFLINKSNTLVPSHFLSNFTIKRNNDSPEAVKYLLETLGKTFKPFSVKVLSTINAREIDFIKQVLEELGLSTDIAQLSLRYYNSIIEERPDIFRVSMYPSFPDPEEYYALFYSRSDESINLCKFNNHDYDLLFEKSQIEQDSQKRLSLFFEMEKILDDETPLIKLYHDRITFYVLPRKIQGFKFRYILPDFREIWVNNEIPH